MRPVFIFGGTFLLWIAARGRFQQYAALVTKAADASPSPTSGATSPTVGSSLPVVGDLLSNAANGVSSVYNGILQKLK